MTRTIPDLLLFLSHLDLDSLPQLVELLVTRRFVHFTMQQLRNAVALLKDHTFTLLLPTLQPLAPPSHPPTHQSIQELRDAVAFLKEQLSPVELQQLLERLGGAEVTELAAHSGATSSSAVARTGGKISVSSIMEMAAAPKPMDAASADAHVKEITQIHSQ